MARSAGHRNPVGLARRSRRALAAALIAAVALVAPAAISGAKGGDPPPPKVETVKNADELAKKQAELDRKLQQATDEAAKRQADIDAAAQRLAAQAAKKQAEIDQHAQHLADEAARKQAELDQRAQKLQLPSSTAAAPSTPTATTPQGQPQLRTTQSATPAQTSVPVQNSAAAAPKVVRHVVHEQAEIQQRRDQLERHVASQQVEIANQRTHLASHVSHEQSELDQRRGEVNDWLARKLAGLLNRTLVLAQQVPATKQIPPTVWQPAAPPPVKIVQNGDETTVIAPGRPATPVIVTAPSTAPGQPTPTPAAPTPTAGNPAPAASSPQGATVVPGTAPTTVSPVLGAVTPVVSNAPTANRGQRARGHGEEPLPLPGADTKKRTPVAVVLHPVARAVAEIPRTVWIGMGGLGAIALALALVSVLQSRRALALVAAQRSLKADVDTLSSAVMPAVPAALGGLALSVASRPANGPASGGDFHDAFELTDGRSAVIVGDVAGHGRESVAATVLVRHTLRAYLEAGLEPRAALATAGAVLADRHEGLLATAVVAVHDSYRSTLMLASAGHVPPVVIGGVGHRPVAVAWPPPLGAGVPTGRRQTTLPLAAGMTVCLFTDGATEARMGEGRVGPAELETWLRELGPDATAEEVLAHLQKHADELDDDVTICVLRSTDPDAVGPPELVEELAVTPGEGPTLIRFLIACGVTPARAAELAVSLEQAPERATLVAEVRIGERSAQARLRPARPALAGGLDS